ncbi:MAG: hypothetical protein BroJett011_23780 [Chloroflexota bacterium]|nr:MAG: hypothetical protein BroJett011_23780 [Chloroflexota bacterium]
MEQLPISPALAEPFSRIFVDRAEAEWAFDLLQETARRLDIHGAYDPRFALTLARRSGRLGLHLNFGGWLVLGFHGTASSAMHLEGASHLSLWVDLALLAHSVSWDERFTFFPFARKKGEPEVRSYHLPLDMIRPMTSELQAAYEATLAFIAQKFAAWQRASHWKQHNPEIAEALFKPEQRERVFAGLLNEAELRYERHLTAFYQDVSEEREEYNVDVSTEEVDIVNLSDLSAIHSQISEEAQMPTKIMTIQALDGIRPEFQQQLFEAMKNCSNPERMLVCLYFMSDLPDEQHHLDEIEENLRKIFPPSLGDGKEPDGYKDFQASMVRGPFSDENRALKEGRVSPTSRLWEKTRRGFWKNTQLGNQRAVEILRREGIQVKFSNDDTKKIVLIGEDFQEAVELNPLYSFSQLAADTGFDEAELARWVRAIERKGQAILYGPPGTGKTFLAEKLAKYLIGGGDGFVELVQFHPAYAYEDFMQGIRPQSEGDRLSYPLMPGRFLEFCGEAQQRTGRCVLIVDEINRANLSRVFGELMYLLEYRDRAIPLAGGGDFHIPANVQLIGTMNTADRSIALVDHALRRRFAFIALAPNYEVLRRFHQTTGFPVEGLIETLTKLNRQIGDPHYHVGITFFLHPHLGGELEDIWRMEIEPYLEEYFFDRPEQAENFRWDRVKESLGRD